jgi:hypothetical protein
MKPRKPKPEPSLIQQLSAPLRDFVNDFKTHGADVLQKVREDNPEKYLELSTKLLPLVAALNPGADDFADCNDMRSIGVKLLKSIGCDESSLTDDMIKEALEANDIFVDRLQAIRDAAQGKMN